MINSTGINIRKTSDNISKANLVSFPINPKIFSNLVNFSSNFKSFLCFQIKM